MLFRIAKIKATLPDQMLVGQELLDKARALSNRRQDEKARGCG